MNANYISYLRSEKRSEGTIKTYVKHINAMLSYLDKSETDITIGDMDAWKCSIAHLKAATVNNKVAAVRDYFTYLHEREYINDNPARLLKNVKGENKVKQYMSAEMVSDMVKHSRTARDKAIILLYASSGMRVSELTGITLAQYNDMKAKGYNHIVITGKGNKKRPVYFNPQVIEAIDSYLNVRKGDEDWLFLSYRGYKASANHLSEMLKNTAKRAGIPFWKDISNHWMRSAAVTIMNDRGIDIGTIRDTVGHGNISVTNRYLKTSEAAVCNAAMAMTF